MKETEIISKMLRVIVLLAAVALSIANEYCDLSEKHTLCVNKGIGPACGEEVLGTGLTDEEAQMVVKIHNDLRRNVSQGLETRGDPGPQPPAANMMELSWDTELAEIAQSHADQCEPHPDCLACRKLSDGTEVGQNIYLEMKSEKVDELEVKKALEAIFSGVDKFSKDDIEAYEPNAGTGMYTQMVWAATTRVGCGYVMHTKENVYRKMLTCNYAPTGNLKGKPVYISGPSCSQCPGAGPCSTENDGLCEDIGAGASKLGIPGQLLPSLLLSFFLAKL